MYVHTQKYLVSKRIQSWSTNEQFLVGKVYEYIRGVKPTVTIPPKMSFILWLAKRNWLLTLDKVAFLNKGSLCPLCSNEPESNAHLFFSHRKSLQVWAHIRDLAPFRRCFTSLQRITDSLIRGRSTSSVQGKLPIAITVYCIWLSRNKLIFKDYQFSVIEVISKIKFLMYRQAHLLHLQAEGEKMKNLVESLWKHRWLSLANAIDSDKNIIDSRISRILF
ncbi:hypothetical protein HKD37_10G029191 [Glycine soja]